MFHSVASQVDSIAAPAACYLDESVFNGVGSKSWQFLDFFSPIFAKGVLPAREDLDVGRIAPQMSRSTMFLIDHDSNGKFKEATISWEGPKIIDVYGSFAGRRVSSVLSVPEKSHIYDIIRKNILLRHMILYRATLPPSCPDEQLPLGISVPFSQDGISIDRVLMFIDL